MKKLRWDTQFWGIDIYDFSDIDKISNVKKVKFSLPASKDFIIQALINDENIKAINYLEDKGFRFAESKVTLVKGAIQINEMFTNNFRKVKIEEIENYKNLFYDLYGKVSRFSLFNKGKVNQFYYTWVLNSIKGKMDDSCIGYYEEEKLAGFITYKCRDNSISIGLLGVFPQFQGHGISKKLLAHIDNIAFNNKCNSVHVSTQGKNVKAINAYIKSGFIFDSIKHWYYMRG
ncbi:MAG: GNAT family N-acetyltransferase [Eubacteriales bacterium]